ncbi:long-chain fatty acid--CoA ligase [Spongiibacter taiwanensis]
MARLAAVFAAKGVAPGDRVAVISPNSDRLFEIILATLWLGGVAVPLNTRWGQSEFVAALADAEPTLLLLREHFADVATGEGFARLVAKPQVMMFRLQDDCDLEDLMAVTEPISDQRCGGDALAFILFTGGTTGRAKGVMLSHSALLTAALNQTAAGCGCSGSVYAHVAPLFHMADLQLMATQLLAMGTHVFVASFNPPELQALVAELAVSDILLVPAMLHAVLAHPDFDASKLAGLKRIFYGAAPMSAALLDRALALLPGCEFVQGYGMTETCLATMLPASCHVSGAEGRAAARLRSAGLELPMMEIRIADKCDQPLPAGQVGEIQICSPALMQGYWRNPEKTREVIRGGWMCTEDLGYQDNDGFLYVVDRLKDMIISGGENVYSSEVESVISRYPGVAQCAVVGLADEHWGERVHAELVLQPGVSFSQADFEDFCRGQMSAYKVPRSVSVVAALPLSPAGKILKVAIRERHAQGRQPEP